MLVRTARRGLTAAVLAAAGLTLAACGSTNASSASSPASVAPGRDDSTNTVTAQHASSPSPAGASGSQDTSTGATGSQDTSTKASGGSGQACATSRLKTTVANASSGAGHTTFQLVFQNTGTAPCTLNGYPGVSFVKIHNTQLGKAASRAGGPGQTVTLIPNAHAYADVQTVNGPGGYTDAQCDLTTVPTLRIFPPNQTESTNIPWGKQECVGSTIQNLQVGPVHSNR